MTGRVRPELSTEVVDRFEDLAADARSLFDLAERQDFQLGKAWLQNLAATAFDPGARKRIHVLRRQDRAIAALPTVSMPRGGSVDLHVLANYYTSLAAVPRVEDVAVEELSLLFKTACRSQPGLRALTLAPLAGETEQIELLHAGLRHAGLRSWDYFCFGNWYLPVRGSSADYMASRPGEVRSTLRRMGKRFAAAGGKLDVLQGATSDDIHAFQRVYGKSWKQDEPHPRFIPGLLKLSSERGWLRLGVARIAGQTVAVQLWIVFHGKASIFKLAYDPEYAQYSPGSLLTAELMRYVIDVDGVAEVDYLTGDDAYKSAWMTDRRERLGIVAYDPRSAAGLWGAARESLGRSSFARTARRAWGSVTGRAAAAG